MAASKCQALFVGLESLDREFLRRFRKRQNLGRNILDDVTYAESQGIAIGYGYLFDPRFQTVAEMEEQLRLIARTDALSMPIGADGKPRDIRVQRGLGMGLDQKAMEAVKQWRFDPATKDGRPVAVQISVEVSFKLY